MIKTLDDHSSNGNFVGATFLHFYLNGSEYDLCLSVGTAAVVVRLIPSSSAKLSFLGTIVFWKLFC